MFGQEMVWKSRNDRVMNFSGKNGQKMTWKWKMKIHCWKWIFTRIFINQMSVRKNLARLELKLDKLNKEMINKYLYRPMKWKDMPAWSKLVPRRFTTSMCLILSVNKFLFKFNTVWDRFGYLKLKLWINHINQLGLRVGLLKPFGG